ncbi:MAG: hypothetical protein OXG35_27295 [Acidobacteria bacterium]|nr:hypothetical protein [Acidobacteriota bacterium]
MKHKVRVAIWTLAHLSPQSWYCDSCVGIRIQAIAKTAKHDELLLCPIAQAVLELEPERLTAVLNDPAHEGFRKDVEAGEPAMREHLSEEAQEECGETPDDGWLNDWATRYAAARVIHEMPVRGATQALLGMDRTTARKIMRATDHVEHGGPATPVLVAALASDYNNLQQQYDAVRRTH